MNRGPHACNCASLPDSGGDPESIDTIPAGKSGRATLRFSAPARGEHEIERLRLTSLYPLGFLRASRRIGASQRYLVYPKPAGDPNLPIGSARSMQNRPRPEFGEGDDFAGVRAYVPGESQRHIDWKAVARGQALMTKQFTAETDGLLYLDFADIRKDREERLSQLTLWVIEAERARHPYGLRLPGAEIPPSMGSSIFIAVCAHSAFLNESTAQERPRIPRRPLLWLRLRSLRYHPCSALSRYGCRVCFSLRWRRNLDGAKGID